MEEMENKIYTLYTVVLLKDKEEKYRIESVPSDIALWLEERWNPCNMFRDKSSYLIETYRYHNGIIEDNIFGKSA